MKRKTREGRIIYYRECYISGTHLSLVWQHYPRISQQHILGRGVGIALWCSMKMDEGANGWLGASNPPGLGNFLFSPVAVSLP